MEIKINWSNLNSIKEAERKKAYYENKGLTLLKTITKGIDKSILVYG